MQERGKREEVAATWGAGLYEVEDFGYQALLDGCVLGKVRRRIVGWRGERRYELGVKFCEARLACIVEN